MGDNLDAVDLGEGEFPQSVRHAELAIARWNVVQEFVEEFRCCVVSQQLQSFARSRMDLR
jgi:hypothetical protein